MQHSASQSSLAQFNKDEFDHIFSDQELQLFLDKVAASDNAHEDALGDIFTDAGPLGLQFLPSESVVPQHFGQGANGNNTSAMSSYDELPRSATAAAVAASTQAQISAAAHLKALSLMAAASTSQQGAMGALAAMAQSPTLAMPSQPFAVPMTMSSTRGAKVAPDTKPQISHSTVEKQRRDRINSLIDELRDLVPPSKATLAAAAAAGGNAKDAANSEARRPKHVVLADTIALLKQLSLRGPLNMLLAPPPPMSCRPSASGELQLPMGPPLSLSPPVFNGAQQPASVCIKEEPHTSPCNSNSKGSVSSQEDSEMKDDDRNAAPKLPIVSKIPIQPTMLSGVVVERGPDCMYVQVKCRDRKGLLLDIINAMKALPLEVRTAAVTTQDGLVRDVFEVSVDDGTLQPEEVQNMVHEALFQQYTSGDKRARS